MHLENLLTLALLILSAFLIGSFYGRCFFSSQSHDNSEKLENSIRFATLVLLLIIALLTYRQTAQNSKQLKLNADQLKIMEMQQAVDAETSWPLVLVEKPVLRTS